MRFFQSVLLLVLLTAIAGCAHVSTAGRRAIPPVVPDQAVEELAGTIRHFRPMDVLWTYTVMLPPDYNACGREYPICLILHGSGSTEVGHGSLAETFYRDGVIYVCPRAPYPHLDVISGMKQPGYTAWFPPEEIRQEQEEKKKPEEGAEEENEKDEAPKEEEKPDPAFEERMIRQYVDWIFTCADDARSKYRVKGDRVHILGHSQGAAYAIACAALHPDRVASFFSYAGLMAEFFHEAEKVKGMKEHGVKGILAHCEGDKVLDVEESRKAYEFLRRAGVDATLKVYEKGDHGFTRSAFYDAKAWLDREVRPDTPVPEKIPTLETGFLGVRAEPFDGPGLKIVNVVEDSSAQKAGLQLGDVLLELDGRSLTDFMQFVQLMRQTKIGQEVVLKIKHVDGSLGERPVKLGARP
jgi:predicted esterase